MCVRSSKFGLRIAMAMAAILAGAEARAVGVGVGARGIGAGARKRAIAVGERRRPEHLLREQRRERRQRIVALARRLERIAAGLYHAADVSRLARDRRRVFELVVIRLELVVGDAPVLDRHVGGDVLLAVALLVAAAHLEFHVGP